jgi:hypothetical protein
VVEFGLGVKPLQFAFFIEAFEKENVSGFRDVFEVAVFDEIKRVKTLPQRTPENVVEIPERRQNVSLQVNHQRLEKNVRFVRQLQRERVIFQRQNRNVNFV